MKLVNVEDLKVLVAVESKGEIRYGKLVTDLFDDIQTVDAEPVRHGRWIEVDSPGDCCYRCSECGFIRDAYLLDISNYCPKCGAKMDGERE